MTEFYKLDERTAFLETPEQREAYLAAARELGDPELLEMAKRTVARAEAVCGDAQRGYGDHITGVDWSKVDYVKADPQTGEVVLPAEWDDPEDEGLYDEYIDNTEQLEAFEELCELTAAVPSVPWPDASKERDREMLAERFCGQPNEESIAAKAEAALEYGIKAAGLDVDRCAWIVGDVMQGAPSPRVCIALYITEVEDDVQTVTDRVAGEMVEAGFGVRLSAWVVPGADASQDGHALADEASRRIFNGEALPRGDAFVAPKSEEITAGEAEDEYLGRIALERLAAHEGEPGIPAVEVYAELGISAAEIEAMPEVELE